jgi:hypothetical protein
MLVIFKKKRRIPSNKTRLEAYAITYIPPTRLAWSGDLYHLAAAEAVVTRNRVCQLDARKLRFFEAAVRYHKQGY